MNILGETVFWGLVVMTVGSAAVVVFHSKIIYSTFALLFTFFGVGGLYVFLTADFLAASQVLIYVGGILTLIIFGVFMTARITDLSYSQQSKQRLIAWVPILLMGFILVSMILRTPWAANLLPGDPTTTAIGALLLSNYLVPFEMASVLLLAALVGAMRMARMFRSQEGEE